jgi:hypothetical protein
MDRFNAIGRGAQIMLVSGVLFFISLFLTWQDESEIANIDVPVSQNGFNGFLGVILALLSIVLIAWIVVRLASVNIPLPVSTAMTAALIGALILIFTIIKLLTILGQEPTIWAWIGVLLAIAIAGGAFMVVQEAGGIDTLKAETQSLGSGSGSSSAAGSDTAGVPPAAPPPPAAPAAPAAHEAAPEPPPLDTEPEAPPETPPADRPA